jgi:hypothetical protein
MGKQWLSMSQEEVKSFFEYDPAIGKLRWIFHPDMGVAWNGRNVGKVAGSEDKRGYRQIGVKGTKYLAHRLTWIYFNGDIPEGLDIDHINRTPSDNRIENLRVATRKENIQNTKPRTVANPSGYRGVLWIEQCQRWRASIQVNGKRKYLGHYKTAEEAAAAYEKADQDLGGGFQSRFDVKDAA